MNCKTTVEKGSNMVETRLEVRTAQCLGEVEGGDVVRTATGRG